MNEHEAERIALAWNVLRPDWPVKQLRTLLADPRMAHRTRRDTMVMLAWVAAETNSASPYRVLEPGPWMRAIAVDQPAGNVAPKVDRHTACTVCGLSEPDCRRRWHDDHAYTSQSAQRAAVVAAGIDVHRAVQGLKDLAATETGEVGTGAGGVDDPAIAAEATSRVNRSVDCPKAPAQAHLPTHEPARVAAKEDT